MNIRLVAFLVLLNLVLLSRRERRSAQSDWKKQWEATVEAGRKEGEVVIYGPHNPAYQQVWAIFQKSYPEVKFSFVPGRGSDHAQRIVAERRAGKFLADSSWADRRPMRVRAGHIGAAQAAVDSAGCERLGQLVRLAGFTSPTRRITPG